MSLKKKLAKLKEIISGYGSCVVAFSGGVDSTLLLKIASAVLPREKLLAVTANSPTYPKEELLFSKGMARRLGIRHKVIRTQELKDKRFIPNPPNRCYFCKYELFSRLKSIATKHNLNFVADASSVSDKLDFRPGSIAIRELKIRSPLSEAGFTKGDIRSLSRSFGLETWDKPSLACLASRIPYGTRISLGLLNRIHKAENYLRKNGFRQVRLRHYNGLCRIEVPESEIQRLINKRSRVTNRLKQLGYNFVTVDLEGYRTGSMNAALSRKKCNKLYKKGLGKRGD